MRKGDILVVFVDRRLFVDSHVFVDRRRIRGLPFEGSRHYGQGIRLCLILDTVSQLGTECCMEEQNITVQRRTELIST